MVTRAAESANREPAFSPFTTTSNGGPSASVTIALSCSVRSSPSSSMAAPHTVQKLPPAGTVAPHSGQVRSSIRSDQSEVRLRYAAASIVATALSGALAQAGVTHAVPRAGSLFGVAFLPEAPLSYAAAQTQEAWRYPAFFHAMLDAGVSLPPSVYEAWFLTAAHDDDALAAVLAALPGAARAAAEARPHD